MSTAEPSLPHCRLFSDTFQGNTCVEKQREEITKAHPWFLVSTSTALSSERPLMPRLHASYISALRLLFKKMQGFARRCPKLASWLDKIT